MQSIDLQALGRTTTLALVGIFVASGCSAFAVEPLALVPDTPTASPETTPGAHKGKLAPKTRKPSATTRPSAAATTPVEAASVDDQPQVRTIRLKPRPKAGPFSIDLYERGDFMHQQNKNWCAAGATQTMMNIIDTGKPNRSARFQQRLYNEGRRLSLNQKKLGSIGMDLTGWAGLLNTRGYGPYVVDGARTRAAAVRKAARAVRLTGKPVGLVAWRGAHAMVMSGFTATADPAFSRDFRVKSVFIQDVWYPYVSTIWGASRPPGSAVPVGALGEDYLPYRRPTARYPKRDGRFMLILPVLPPDTVVR